MACPHARRVTDIGRGQEGLLAMAIRVAVSGQPHVSSSCGAPVCLCSTRCVCALAHSRLSTRTRLRHPPMDVWHMHAYTSQVNQDPVLVVANCDPRIGAKAIEKICGKYGRESSACPACVHTRVLRAVTCAGHAFIRVCCEL
jgi:hypothetical protein